MNSDTTLLRQQLEELSPELYDWIFKLTFTAEPGFVKVTRKARQEDGHCSPCVKLLHVSRSTRAMYAPKYYSNSVFLHPSPRSCKNWLSTIADEHKQYLQDVRCLWYQVPQISPEDSLGPHLSPEDALIRPGFDIAQELRRINNWFHARTCFQSGPRGLITMFGSEQEVGRICLNLLGEILIDPQMVSWPLVPLDWKD
jgi:hypothetical protein